LQNTGDCFANFFSDLHASETEKKIKKKLGEFECLKITETS